MAIQLRNTRDAAHNGVKILVYGFSGAGKTTLIKTAPNPVVLSAEAGLLSLSDMDIPYIEINTMDDLKDAYRWLLTEEGLCVELVNALVSADRY